MSMPRAGSPARVATAVAVVAGALLGVSLTGGAPDAAARDGADRIGQVRVNGLPATGIVGALPAVGDGPAILRYHEAGLFDADRALVATAAHDRLNAIVLGRCPEGPAQCQAQRLALVVDIDDTLLDWYPSYARYAFDLPAAARQARVASCATPVIGPVRTLVRDARAHGVAVLIVSGRRQAARQATESCLHRRGVWGWEDLVLRNRAQDALAASEYKRQAMRELIGAGWHPVISIGDQQGDVASGWGLARFLLPNPLYRAT